VIRYRFADFTLSPQRRTLVRAGQDVPLIPRYFDLLVLLVERRHEAVHRREILERVWADTTVSDSALSQAIRTIRRTLGDDTQEPRFIRTVSRHGYQFVLPDVIEEQDTGVSTEVTLPAPVRSGGWSGASMGGAVAGVVAGAVGGLILTVAPGSDATFALAPVLAVIGGTCGALGGGGVGAGLALADQHATSHRTLALIAAAAIGGGISGTAVQWLARWGLSALLGVDVAVGGALAGVVIGGAAGVGYVFARERYAAAITAGLCGLVGLALTLVDYPLVGGTIHAIANAADGSRATLAPLGRLIGEPDFGPVSRAILACGEAVVFGLGLTWGLRRRA
jgi:DNA-binding winged helix-turn-helix (wHTH) protein